MPNRMSEICCVKQCRNKKNNKTNIHLYRFPKGKNLFNTWCYNLQINVNCDKIKKNLRICNRHFDQKLVGKRRLLKDAIPTKFLGHSNDIEVFVNNPHNYRKKCSVPNCNKSGNSTSLFTFPTETESRQKWIDFFKLNNESRKHLYACKNHFEPQNIGKKKLRKNVIPTKNILHLNPLESIDKNVTNNMISSAKEENFKNSIINDDIINNFENNFDSESSDTVDSIPEHFYADINSTKSANYKINSKYLEFEEENIELEIQWEKCKSKQSEIDQNVPDNENIKIKQNFEDILITEPYFKENEYLYLEILTFE